MKKFLISFILIIMCISTFSFATTEEVLIKTNDLENENEDIATLPDEIKGYISGIENDDGYRNEKDDVYIADQTANLKGVVDSNVYMMGQTANLKDLKVYGNVYVMAEEINFDNVEIAGSIYAMAKDINFSGTASDIYFLAGTINFSNDSQILRNSKIAGGDVLLNGNFERNVLISCDELKVDDKANVKGKLTYYSDNEASISSNAQIAEKEFIQSNLDEVKEETGKAIKNVVIVSIIKKFISVMVKTLVVALIIVFCINKFGKLNRTESLASDFAKNAGIGCLNLIFVPVLSILFMITGIGAGLGITLLIIYFIALYLSISIASIEIAKRIIKTSETEKNYKSKFVGLAVLVSAIIQAIGYIPVIGGIVKIILVLIGLGILFNLVFQKQNKEK